MCMYTLSRYTHANGILKDIRDLSSFNKRNFPSFCFSFDHKEIASLRRYHTLCHPGFFVSRGRFLAYGSGIGGKNSIC